MLETGARAGEVVAPLLADVDLAGGTVLIRRGKGGEDRTAPIGPHAGRALDRYLRARRGHRLVDTTALWLGDRGKEFSYDGLHAALKTCAGVAGFHPAPAPAHSRPPLAHSRRLRTWPDGR